MSARQDLLDLRRDLLVAAATVSQRAEPVLGRAGLVIKNAQSAAAAAATPKGYARHYPSSISYDVDRDPETGTVRLEVGPDKAKVQGALGNILVFGTRNNSPTYDDTAALHAEMPQVEQHLADLGERLLS